MDCKTLKSLQIVAIAIFVIILSAMMWRRNPDENEESTSTIALTSVVFLLTLGAMEYAKSQNPACRKVDAEEFLNHSFSLHNI